ncbi:MAG: hypothetical protein MUC88_09360 [Planctomycetes bacterium]|jgi:hypothetical protein|nr:hypothetical protein [Planctomycetota bacterium]
MLTCRPIAAYWAIVLCAAPVWAQAINPQRVPPAPRPARPAPSLSSAAAAARFWEIGHEIARSGQISGPQADQAIILLTAAKSLNSQLVGAEPLLLKLATRRPERDYSQPILFWLQRYASESADRAVVTEAVQYLLNRLPSLEERKVLLEKLVGQIGNKSPGIDSEMATLLGLVMQEKGDLERAKFYLVQAYTNNKFNRTAFERLGELAPNEIGPATHLEHLRLLVRENPLDLNVALAFAGYAERLQLYGVAAQGYDYCAQLFRYLYPTELLPQRIYLPWAISCYNTPQGLPICLHIAKNIRERKQFDILLEAIAARAAIRMNQPEIARQICQETVQKAQELLLLGPGPLPASEQAGVAPVRPANARQLAWFYCFADPNMEMALDWANRAYSAEPNSPAAAALLAYALSVNNRLELAKPLLSAAEPSQIVDLVQARMQAAAGNKAGAIQTLQATLARDAGSLAAEKARMFLRELGGEYTPAVDTRTLLSFLTERLGQALVPEFLPPDKMVEIQFGVRGNDFSYGREIEGVVAIVNKGPEPLVLTANSLFQGSIRIGARVEGSIQREIPTLVFETIRSALMVAPGQSLSHNVRLSTGELREILTSYPQAALQIQFTLNFDPVMTDSGQITNRLVDVPPLTRSLTRPPVRISRLFIENQVTLANTGPEAQKIQASRLLTGLLREQQIMQEKGILYQFSWDPSLQGILRSALTGSSGPLLGAGQGDWTVKVNAMADMLPMSIDQELATAVARNLNHPQWPVRLMALYLLAQRPGPNFGSILDWVTKNDADELVRSMAVSLQSTASGASAM